MICTECKADKEPEDFLLKTYYRINKNQQVVTYSYREKKCRMCRNNNRKLRNKEIKDKLTVY